MTNYDQAPLLTPQLLESFHDSLARAGFPFADFVMPGLSDDQMDEITAPLGLTLPPEARVWWGRHNGTRAGGLIGSYRTVASLEKMVAEAQLLRELHRETYEEVGVTTWDDRLLPLIHSDTVFGCDCSAGSGPSAIWIWEPKEADALEGPVLPSFGALVEIWRAAIDERIFEYLPDRGYTVFHPERIEPGRWPRLLP